MQRPETLHELLDQHGIELHEMPRPGRQHGGTRSKIYCPECQGGREKERNFFVKIDPDGQGATWCCFRANHCGFTGGARLATAPRWVQDKPRNYRRPDPPLSADRPPELIAYFAKFGISADTLASLGIYRTTHAMPVIDTTGKQVPDRWATRPVIAYPYRDGGSLINIKYKAVYGNTGVKRFIQERDTERSLFNIDSFTDTETGIIVEGEDDVAAVFEAGYRQVTTLPDGSPPKISAEYDPTTDDDQRYVALRHEPRLERLKRIILAGDMDEAGARHHEEIARRLGKARCWIARWPAGCKDAKDTLAQRGPAAVRWVIENAEPFPLEGVYYPSDEEIANLYAGVQDYRIETGYHAIDSRFALSTQGQFIVCTGVPGHGKTTFWHCMSVLYTLHQAERMRSDPLARPFHTVIVSPEMKLDRVTIELISQKTNRPFFPSRDEVPRLDLDDVLREHLPWVRRHFTLIKWSERSTQPPVSWVLDRVEENVIRTGAKLAIVDPWQEMDDEMPEREANHSKWVGKILQRFVALADRLSCNIVLTAHPHQMKRDRDGKYPIPGGYDIGYSQNFYSRSDLGMTIYRENLQGNDMLLRVWKKRDRHLAMEGDTNLKVDRRTSRVWPQLVGAEALDEDERERWSQA